MFSNACGSASITSVMSKWWPSSFSFNQGNRKVGKVGDDVDVVKNSLVKRKWENVRCRDTTASSFVAKVRGEVFSHIIAVAVKRHSSVRYLLFGLPGWILLNSPFDIKEKIEHALGFALHFPLGRQLFCLRVITVNPAPVTWTRSLQLRRRSDEASARRWQAAAPEQL
jgi:hypothetical protein